MRAKAKVGMANGTRIMSASTDANAACASRQTLISATYRPSPCFPQGVWDCRM